MCYFVHVYAELTKFRRFTGADVSSEEYVKPFCRSPFRMPPRGPHAMVIEILRDAPLEILSGLEQEPFKHKKRVGDTERALQGGRQRGLIIADVVYEEVKGPDGQNQVLAFILRSADPMLIACLWNLSPGYDGEPDFYSAAITDEPEPDVAGDSHDRTIINIKPEHLDSRFTPGPSELDAIYRVFDDERRPYYEHQLDA